MAHINLLPWRERLREERKREFLTILVGVVIISGGVLFLADRYINGAIDSQSARNGFLQSEITILDEQVAEIGQLRQQKEDIRARMNVITGLQGTRPVIVRVFDELVKTLPEGVYYTKLERVVNTISIEGVAESNSGISELMRRLDDSEWFRSPSLSDISAADISSQPSLTELVTFTLSFVLQLPDQQDEGA